MRQHAKMDEQLSLDGKKKKKNLKEKRTQKWDDQMARKWSHYTLKKQDIPGFEPCQRINNHQQPWDSVDLLSEANQSVPAAPFWKSASQGGAHSTNHVRLWVTTNQQQSHQMTSSAYTFKLNLAQTPQRSIVCPAGRHPINKATF